MHSAIRHITAAAILALIASSCSASSGQRAEASRAAPVRTEAQPASSKSPAATAEPVRRLGRTPLPLLARDVLVEPMRTHGDNLESLLWTTLMLDHESTATIATWIAEEPRLSRPREALDIFNAALPAGFFVLQDELYASADQLARAARNEDDAGVADAFSRLAGTCIRCHSLYLRMPRPGRSQ